MHSPPPCSSTTEAKQGVLAGTVGESVTFFIATVSASGRVRRLGDLFKDRDQALAALRTFRTWAPAARLVSDRRALVVET